MRARMRGQALAMAALVVAVLVRWLLDPWLGDSLPFVTAFGAVAAAVWAAGWRPASVVAIIGYFAFSYLFIPPRHTFVVWHLCARGGDARVSPDAAASSSESARRCARRGCGATGCR